MEPAQAASITQLHPALHRIGGSRVSCFCYGCLSFRKSFAAQAGHGHSTVTDLTKLRGVACGVRPALRAFTSLARCERTPKPRNLQRPSCAEPCCSDQIQS